MIEPAGFAAVAAVVIVTPGPDTALTIRNALLGGSRGGVCTAGGVSAGQAVWALATAAGLASLLAASHPAFLAVRLIGAAYLFYLGVQALRLAVRSRPSTPGRRSASALMAPPRALRQGLLSNLANPKMAVFFIGVLPTFARGGAFAAMLALGLLFSAMTFAWLCAYVALVARGRDLLAHSRTRRIFDAAAGSALVGLGIRIAIEQP